MVSQVLRSSLNFYNGSEGLKPEGVRKIIIWCFTMFTTPITTLLACFHLKKHRHKEAHSITSAFPLPMTMSSLPMMGLPMMATHSIPSAMDLMQNHALMHHGVAVHFHLAGSINAETDIPLVPPLKHHNFRVFWLNNKEMFFTQKSELILQEICRKGVEREDSGDGFGHDGSKRSGIPKSNSQDDASQADDSSQPSLSSAASSNSLAEGMWTEGFGDLERKLESLMRDWQRTPDVLVSLHPIDGSFLVWSVEWLDEYMPGCFRQAQVSFSSCIPGAIPLADATSMSSPNLYLFPLEKLAANRAGMMTKHHNGSLNLWTLSFGDDSKFCQVMSVAHAKRASGHRFQVREMACHPVLPLVLTAASHAFSTYSAIDETDSDQKQHHQNYCSELILWRVDPIGPLCKSGGVVEVARINSSELDAFSHVAWVPGLLPSTSLFSNSGCFVASDGTNLRVYQAVLDASNLLAEISTAYRKRKASLNDSVVSLSSSSSMSSIHGVLEDPDPDLFAIVSQQSTSRPGCILQLDRIDNQNWGEVSFIQVFRDDLDPTRRGGAEKLPSIITTMEKSNKKSFLNISISKLFEQTVCPGLDVSFSACSGHFVCGSSYALISTSKESVKLWKLARNDGAVTGVEDNYELCFKECNTLAACKEKGQMIQASAAYSGRIACVYKMDRETKDRNLLDEDKDLDANAEGQPVERCESCAITVYECESSGGTDWLLEDTIELKTDEEVTAVHLEWIPKHDAQHILALAITDMVCLFAHVSREPSVTFGAKVLPATASCKSQYWLPLHAFKLSSADGLRPFPVRFGWIHAVCVVAMRNEMQVYSQWALENLTDVSTLLPSTSQFNRQHTEIGEQSNRPHIELSLLSGSVGLFQYTRHCYPVLPQYHPSQLLEMLNSGKARWVRVILAHLVRYAYNFYTLETLASALNERKCQRVNFNFRCLGGGAGSLKRQNSLLHDEDGRQRSYSRSRCLSVSYPGPTSPSPLEHRNSMIFQPEDLSLNYAEMRTIPPVPLWMLLSAEKETSQPLSEDKTKDYNDLFNMETTEEPLDESVFDDFVENDDEDGMGTGTEGRKRRRSTSGDNQPLTFGQRQSRQLSRVLTHTQLPGLTSLDQMHLLALADTVAAIGTRLDHRDVQQSHIHDGTPDSLDECGLRFLIVVKQYTYLVRCLPPAQRVQLQKQGISTSDVVWAFHSESQEDILNLIPAYQKGNMTWQQLREIGVGWWLRNNQTLRLCMEKLGKHAFQREQDPMDAAIFFLAMKKKTLLWGLYRSNRNTKMEQFFQNDFSQERWRKAALKNAYALLGKQRFEHAAAFFLLSGSLKDALEVCLSKLKDIQLALVIARLYDGGDLDPIPPSVKNLLQTEIINPRPGEVGEAERDPFLCSIALWMLKEYQSSLDILLETKMSSRIFNFYVFLRSHPLLVRQNKAKGTLALNSQERRLYFFTAHEHYAAGCPTLAIHVLSQLPKAYQKLDSKLGSPIKPMKTLDSQIESGIITGFDETDHTPGKLNDSGTGTSLLDFGPKETKKDNTVDFDWGSSALSSKKADDDELKLDWDDDENSEDENKNSDEAVVVNHRDSLQKSGKNLLNNSVSKDEDSVAVEDLEEDLNDPQTVIAVELKLASCLKLMSEEIVSIAGQLEGTELRLHLYAWLEKQVPTLKELCKYQSDDDEVIDDEWNMRDRSLTPKLDTHSSGLHDILLSEKLDLEWKMGVITRRSRWLKANRHLLATLLAFSRLHAHALAPVYIELVFLLDELQKEKSSGTGPSLVSPLPFLHSEFPLLSAVANPTKTAVSFIQSSARDILHTICELIAAPVFPLPKDESQLNRKQSVAESSIRSHAAKSEDGLEDEEVEESKKETDADADELNEDEINNASDGSPIKKSSDLHEEGSEVSEESKEEMSAVVCDWRVVLVLRDSAVALSACLFQALSDSEGETTKDVGVSLLYAPRRRRWSSSGTGAIDGIGEKVISTPDKWPGVSILRGILSREEDGESPKLKYLLVECYAAVFSSILVHSIAICDAKAIFRLLAKKMDATAFSSIFGGGTKRQIKLPTVHQLHPQTHSTSSDKDGGDTSPSSVWTTFASLNKARMKFNMKLLGQQFTLTSPRTPTASAKARMFVVLFSAEERPSFREKFVPPEIPIYGYLLGKPNKPRLDSETLDGHVTAVDSEDEEDIEEEVEDEEEEDDGMGWEPKMKTNTNTTRINEGEDPFSYSWRLMRLAAVKLARKELERIVEIAGIDAAELSHISPFLDGVMRVFTVWKQQLFNELEAVSPAPLNYLQNATVENLSGPPIHKYRALLEPSNTPFLSKKSTFGLRRLWTFLVREEDVQNYFIRFVFGKKRPEDTFSLFGDMTYDGRVTKKEEGTGTGEESEDECIPAGPVRIVHKDHESISAFCLNQSGNGLMALATPKEIQELDVSVLLQMESWKFEDQFELDLINLYKDPETLSNSSYLVVQSPSDRKILENVERPQKGSHSLILKHRVDGVRRMASHPTLPLSIVNQQPYHVSNMISLYLTDIAFYSFYCQTDLSGSQDGSVRLWEFSHAQPVAVPRPPGTFAKVNRIRFHGNKFGVCDGDGRLSLWQIGANPRPFYTVQCHSKQTSDFVFLGSSSLIASGGISTESKNVALWDTLMPMKKAQIASFTCHEQGCVALSYSEEHQSLISAGKKGAVCIWDIRQRSLRHRFQGHESAIKCLCLDPSEEFFCTGAADGDIKVWDFNGKARAVFPAEHSRSGFFKNIPGQGVTQLSLEGSRRLFSCGADGSVKIRLLLDKFMY
ncbi:DmX-like protein 2 [Orchesella cincta]|uniref:DmX-like protein 2 n=1 Tax=Orchesella cincta TaxID=48709 RepID=A0A1D2MWA3_ORCCI|nr:DmX-like protein 2 [Orchesella cincta]